MAIIRAKRSKNFTVIDNQVFADNQLSFAAMGLLAYLLSKPDNWTVSAQYLATVTQGAAKRSGINAVHELLKELRSNGFVVMKKRSTGETDYFVFDAPQTEKPNQEKPNQEKPNQEKPNQEKPDVLINTEIKQELNNKQELNRESANNALTQAEKPKHEKSHSHETDLQILQNLGVSEQLAKDWLQTRKEKRAGSLTPTVVSALEREAAKAGLTVAQAVQVAAERNWARFMASYLHNEQQGFAGSLKAGGGIKPNRITQTPKHGPEAQSGLARDVLKGIL